MNGVVELLIRNCRRGLDAAVNYLNRCFTSEEWQTFLSEVMYLINSRPLYPDGSDCVGSPPITGNDLLHPFRQPTVPQPEVEDRPNPRDIVKALQQRVLGDVAATYATASDRKIKMVSSAAEPRGRRLGVVVAARPKGWCCTARAVGTCCGNWGASWRPQSSPQSHRADCWRELQESTDSHNVPNRNEWRTETRFQIDDCELVLTELYSPHMDCELTLFVNFVQTALVPLTLSVRREWIGSLLI